MEAAWHKQFGNSLPDRDISSTKFEEQQFGSVYDCGQEHWCQLSKEVTSCLSDRVVSLALFDGDEMLFACTSIVLPRGTSKLGLTRFLTSSRLVTVFNQKRNKDDKLRVAVRLPNKRTIPGFLGLYDKYIAIVTSLGLQSVSPLDMYRETDLPDAPMMVAAGRAYESCSLMGTTGALTDAPIGVDYEHLSASTCQTTEAGIGGPLIDLAGNFVGVNICFHGDTGNPLFLPRMLLRQRLEKYEILTPGKTFGGIITPYTEGFSIGITNKSSQGSYVPPPGTSRIIPSGFMDTWNWLEFMGYPKPPPLMLELNWRLVRKFDDIFGCLHAWKGYRLGIPFTSEKNAWRRFDKKIVETISRRVVSLVSFNGNDSRFLSCTGFLVRCPLKSGRTRAVIVTSASLVRICDATDTVDDSMRIEMFLPPNQRLNGTLEAYHSGYNIAIVTVKGLRSICPEDIQVHPESSSPRTVVAIGRDPEGVLCASMGEPVCPGKDLDKPTTFGCSDLKLSTCKIKTVGIGGPLINIEDGSLFGMNFYDGTNGRTPFLPYMQIREVLHLFGLELQRRKKNDAVRRLDGPDDMNHQNRWPVPQPYWYHGVLEVDRFAPIFMRGRILH